ncbi:glutaredoxin domain-containing protein [Aureimonas sp. AU40]|uniref:glutaredoxin domain-containing protein n=1 Tax=Aureimonas sp. AU40 TaxID=1637747 RepID=UPI0007823E5F|nr:glutaredoxin domain-containing protein [Aureimonas sp. AU40]
MSRIIEIYGRSNCGFCARAKELVASEGLAFRYHDVADPALKAEMDRRAPGARTVPQIFAAGEYIGGFDDLEVLHLTGTLPITDKEI